MLYRKKNSTWVSCPYLDWNILDQSNEYEKDHTLTPSPCRGQTKYSHPGLVNSVCTQTSHMPQQITLHYWKVKSGLSLTLSSQLQLNTCKHIQYDTSDPSSYSCSVWCTQWIKYIEYNCLCYKATACIMHYWMAQLQSWKSIGIQKKICHELIELIETNIAMIKRKLNYY